MRLAYFGLTLAVLAMLLIPGDLALAHGGGGGGHGGGGGGHGGGGGGHGGGGGGHGGGGGGGFHGGGGFSGGGMHYGGGSAMRSGGNFGGPSMGGMRSGGMVHNNPGGANLGGMRSGGVVHNNPGGANLGSTLRSNQGTLRSNPGNLSRSPNNLGARSLNSQNAGNLRSQQGQSFVRNFNQQGLGGRGNNTAHNLAGGGQNNLARSGGRTNNPNLNVNHNVLRTSNSQFARGNHNGNWNHNGSLNHNGNNNWNHNGNNWHNNGWYGGNNNYWRNRSYFFGIGSPFGGYFGYPGYNWGYPYYGYRRWNYWPWFGYGLGWGGYGGYGYGLGGNGYGYGYPYYCYAPGVTYDNLYDDTLVQDPNAALQNPLVLDPNADPNADPNSTTAAYAPDEGTSADSLDFAAQGEEKFRAGDYQSAIRYWRHSLVDEPNNGAVVLLLGQALFAIGQYDEAAGAAQQGMNMLPKDQWGAVVSNYTQLYGNIQDYTDELKALEKAAQAKPESPALRFLLGYHYGFLGYPKQAVRELDKAVQLEPKDKLAKSLRELMAKKLDGTSAEKAEKPMPQAEPASPPAAQPPAAPPNPEAPAERGNET